MQRQKGNCVSPRWHIRLDRCSEGSRERALSANEEWHRGKRHQHDILHFNASFSVWYLMIRCWKCASWFLRETRILLKTVDRWRQWTDETQRKILFRHHQNHVWCQRLLICTRTTTCVAVFFRVIPVTRELRPPEQTNRKKTQLKSHWSAWAPAAKRWFPEIFEALNKSFEVLGKVFATLHEKFIAAIVGDDRRVIVFPRDDTSDLTDVPREIEGKSSPQQWAMAPLRKHYLHLSHFNTSIFLWLIFDGLGASGWKYASQAHDIWAFCVLEGEFSATWPCFSLQCPNRKILTIAWPGKWKGPLNIKRKQDKCWV